MTKHYWQRKFEDFDTQIIDPRIYIDPKSSQKIFKRYVEVVNLELDSYCNRKCIYCPVSKFSRTFKQNISEDVMERVLGDLTMIDYDKTICLNLYNEPLFNLDEFVTNVSLIKSRLPRAKVVTNSNGDYLDYSKLLKVAQSGLMKLNITIHPPKGRHWKLERERRAFTKFMEKINLGGVEIDSQTPTSLRHATFVDGMELTIQSVNWFQVGNARGGSTDGNKMLADRQQPCVKPFREFTIFYDGSVTQCCDAFYNKDYQRNRLASVTNQDSIFEIYSSQVLRKIRLELFDWSSKSGICRHCSAEDLSDITDQNLRREVLDKLPDDEVIKTNGVS